MIDESMVESIKKASYYCQSCYTSINVFNDLVKNRKLELLDRLLIKILEDLSCLVQYYSNVKLSVSAIDSINKKLGLIMEGYENSDYYYIKDVFEYEILPEVENIFNEINNIINENI